MMFARDTHIREWIPAGMAVAAVLITAAYAVTKTLHAQEGIRRAGNLASALSNTATTAESTTLTAEQIAELKTRRDDLEERVREAGRAGCVVAQLTETARAEGLSIQEIQPLHSTGRNGAAQETFAYPRYRIIVQGTYQQVAEYMDRCKSQRIPARVMEYRIARTASREASAGGQLTADIIVEAFQSQAGAAQPGKGV